MNVHKGTRACPCCITYSQIYNSRRDIVAGRSSVAIVNVVHFASNTKYDNIAINVSLLVK